MPSRVLRTDQHRKEWQRFLDAQSLPMTVSQVSGEERTKAMNRLVHKWFTEIAVFFGDRQMMDVKAECNLEYGRPILARDDPEWEVIFGYLFDHLDHERKLKAIKKMDVPFTRRMTIKQLLEYMNQMQRDYLEMGVRLTDPEAREYGYEG